MNEMIKNFLVISCIGKDDKLGLRINKDFFIKKINNKKNYNDKLVFEISYFLKLHKVELDEAFSVLLNQGPGSFSSIRTSLAVAKGLEMSKKVKLYGFNNQDLEELSLEKLKELLKGKLFEKNLITPIYLS